SWQEYWRKLYVGMTRAEDELYVTGALTPNRSREVQVAGSWYEAIETSLRPDSAVEADEEGNETALVYPRLRPAPAPVREDARAPAAVASALILPPLPVAPAVTMVRP